MGHKGSEGGEDLRLLVQVLHKARGRHNTQLATCRLFDACGLPATWPKGFEPQPKPEEFLYSQDGEEFDGPEATREAALEQAQCDADNENPPGTLVMLCTGRPQHPAEVLRKNAGYFGERVADLLAEYVTDDLGCEDLALQVDAAQHEELGLLLANWIEQNAVVMFSGVKDIEIHKYHTKEPT